MGVVAVHLLGASGVLARFEGTATGVVLWSVLGNSIDAFFIISAFALFLPTVARRGEFGKPAAFWIGRAVRLLPAYLLVLAITLFVVLVKPPAPDYPFPTIAEIAAHLTLLQMPALLVDPGFRIGFGVDGPLWLISVVVTFYLLLPFVARAYYRHPLTGLLVAATITVAWKEMIARSPGLIDWVSSGSEQFVRYVAVDQFPGWAFSFGLGMTGAWAFVRAKQRHSPARLAKWALVAAPAVVAIYVLASYTYGHHALTVPGNVGPIARSYAGETLLNSASRAALMGVLILGPLWLQRPFSNRVTAKLAELSYGVYLVHWLLVTYAFAFLDLPTGGTPGSFAIWIAVIVPPSLLFAALSRRYLELPIQGWVRRRRGVPGAPADGIRAQAV